MDTYKKYYEEVDKMSLDTLGKHQVKIMILEAYYDGRSDKFDEMVKEKQI